MNIILQMSKQKQLRANGRPKEGGEWKLALSLNFFPYEVLLVLKTRNEKFLGDISHVWDWCSVVFSSWSVSIFFRDWGEDVVRGKKRR